MSLTKDELLNLSMKTRSVQLGNLGDITIRQLTNKESDQVECTQYNYTTTILNNETNEQTINLIEQKKAEQKAKLATVMYGLNVGDENWTIEEINELPASIVNILYNEIVTFNKE